MTRITHLHIYILTSLVFASCETNLTNNKELRSSNNKIVYDIGFPIRSYQYFKNERSEYLSFIDYTSYRKVSINSIDGIHRSTIDLNHLIEKENEDFNSFYTLNNDTIALLSKYSNKVYLINQRGNIILKKDYSDLLLNGLELYPPLSIDKGVLRTGTRIYHSYFDTLSKSDINRIQNHSAKLFIDSHFVKQSRSSYLTLDSLYSRFTNDDEMSLETKRYIFVDDKIYFHSIFSDSVYIFNDDYSLEDVKQISSNEFDINLKPTKFNVDKNNVKLSSKNAWYHSNVWKLLYDQYRNVFYCFIRGPYEENKFPFSIIIYDLDFNKLHEKRFDKDVYKPNGFVGSKGLYIERHGENEMKKKEFEIFNYE